MIDIPVIIDLGAFMPEKAHESDAGYDIKLPMNAVWIDDKYDLVESKVAVPAGGSATIDTEVHMLIPRGYVGFLKSKSGLNVKNSITGEGVIDAGYTGSIVVKLYNDSDEDYIFKSGNKLIQIVILPVPETSLTRVDKFPETDRGDNGFGSSGK